MRVLLDTNIVLDLLLNRSPWKAEATSIVRAEDEGWITAFVTSLTVANVYYISQRAPGFDPMQAVRACLDTFEILPVDRLTLEDAYARPGGDFEDSIQIVAARRSDIDVIVTRDRTGFVGSPVRVLSPRELSERLSGDHPAPRLTPEQQ